MLDCQQGLRGILLGAWEQESKCWLILSEYGSALYPNPAIFRPSFSAVKIAPSESACSSLRKIIKICAFSSIYYQTSSAIIFHFFYLRRISFCNGYSAN